MPPVAFLANERQIVICFDQLAISSKVNLHALIASVIGHGIGGTNFPDIMARLAKMQDRWVIDDRPVCHHPISRPVKSVMAKRSTYVDVMYYREFLT